MTTDFIRNYWDQQALQHGTSPVASWGDEWMIRLEVEAIGRHFPAGGVVLDVGCANGHATLQQRGRGAAKIIGVDYSPPMICEAERNLREHPSNSSESAVKFLQADVRDMPFPEEQFDYVYTTRVLINLPSWDEQQQGIRECLRVCKRGGSVLLSEAFWEPLMLLNSLRALKQLPPLVEHDFNRYLKKDHLEAFLCSKALSFELDEFSSVYYLGSRFLRDLITDPAAWPGYSNPINRIFYDLEQEFSGGGFGIQQAYLIKKP